jgi:hypothetical protein
MGRLAYSSYRCLLPSNPMKVLKPDGILDQEAFAPLFGDFEDMYIDSY